MVVFPSIVSSVAFGEVVAFSVGSATPGLGEKIIEWIHGFAGSPLALLVLAGLCFMDAFFPPLPAESIVIGLTSWYFASAPGEVVPLPLIFVCAVVGAMLGDSFAFWLGTLIPVERIKFLNEGKGKPAYDLACRMLHKRGTSFIFAARFIPGGRVAVNMCAGATKFGYPRFLRTDFAAVLCWVAYGMTIGYLSGRILGPINPLLSVVVGMTGGVLLSLILDRVVSWWQAKFWDPKDETAPETDPKTGTDNENAGTKTIEF